MDNIRNLTISSTHPCLIVYLIDQSQSMGATFGNANHSKATEVAGAVNDIIYELALKCIGREGELKNRFELAVIGYGKEANKVQSGWEGSLNGRWVISINDIFNNVLETKEDRPVWIKPYANQNTPMTRAFENAKRLCKNWIDWGNHMDCHPPIIINITDGVATDAGPNFSYLKNEIDAIKRLSTNYGSVHILNVHISDKPGEQILFPNQKPTNGRFGSLLFDNSTLLNENMIRIANNQGYNIKDGAKGYVYNGSATDLINFLNIGSPL